jgi:plasmid stability protein
MGRTVQIRNVDEHAYTVLRTRAAAENLSLTAYLKRQLEDMASHPTMAELLAKADQRRAESGGVATEDIVAALHDSRREWDEDRWPSS